MMRFPAARTWIVAAVLILSSVAGAQQVPVPELNARVTDLTATLTSAQKSALEQKLQAFESSKGSQLAVLMIPTTGEESIEQYSLRVVELWQLGRKKIDDGALLIVARNDRTLRIEVGYGLEGALTDATSKRIINEIIVPYFRKGAFYEGIDAGLERMIRVIEGEPLPEPARRVARGDADFFQIGPVVLMLVVVVGGVLRALLGRLPAAVVTGGAATVLAWLFMGALVVALLAGLIAFIFTLLGGTGRRGGWHSGGGGFGGGGFGGGGFSGGGGGFGGGGASGRW